MAILFNLDRAIEVTKILKNHFDKLEEKDANVPLPETIIIGSVEHLNYLFYSCLLNHSVNSTIYHQNMINTYNEYPNIFDPRYVVEKFLDNKEELYEILKKNVRHRYPRKSLEKWLYLSNVLYYDYKNDLFDILTCYNSFSRILEEILSIKGFGDKTGGLLVRLMIDNGFVEFNDEVTHIPIDRHDLEISIFTNILNKENPKDNITQKHKRDLAQIWIKASNELNVNPNDLDKYLWLVGSKYCNKKLCNGCPLKNYCTKNLSKKETCKN